MSQEKVNAYKDSKTKRKEEAAKAKKKKAGKKFRDVVFAVIMIGIAVGIVVSVVNMVGTYKDSLPEYEATDYVLADYAEVATEETDLSDIVSGDGTVIVDDEGQVSDASEAVSAAADSISEYAGAAETAEQ